MRKKLLSTAIFLLSVLFMFVLLLCYFITSISIRNILFCIGIIFIVIIAALMIRRMKQGNFFALWKLNSCSAGLLVFFLLFLFTTGGLLTGHVFGNNLVSTQYSTPVGPKGYNSLDLAVADIETEKLNEGYYELFRTELPTYAAVFYCSTSEVVSYEFFIDGSKYYTYGGRSILFDSIVLENMEKYSEEQTMLSDIDTGLKINNWKALNKTGIFPAFGVLNTSQIYDVTINGQEIDNIKEIETVNGDIFYFWFIEDLEVNKTNQVSIWGL